MLTSGAPTSRDGVQTLRAFGEKIECPKKMNSLFPPSGESILPPEFF